MAYGVIVAGGSGSRFGRSGGKQLAPILGRPCLSWSIEAMAAARDIEGLVLVVHPDRVSQYETEAVTPLGIRKPYRIVGGGDTRQQSVAAGLAAIPEGVAEVAIHDGARPVAGPELVDDAIEALRNAPDSDGVVVGYPSSDTVKIVREGRVVSTLDRSEVWLVQTPQVFRVSALRAALARAEAAGFSATDDAGLIEWSGGVVRVIEGPRDNMKLTRSEDEALAASLLALRGDGGQT